MPRIKCSSSPGNNTGTGILQKYHGCQRHRTYLRNRSGYHLRCYRFLEYGHWSDTAPQSDRHDRSVSTARRTDQEYREVKENYLSVLLSGHTRASKTTHSLDRERSFSRASCFIICTVYGPGSTSFESGETDLKPSSQA